MQAVQACRTSLTLHENEAESCLQRQDLFTLVIGARAWAMKVQVWAGVEE